MLDRVISGGQAGADQAGWRAAKACGIPTGGWMPKGFLTEDGPCPEFAELYGATELPTAYYPARIRRNVLESDGTLWFGSFDSGIFTTTHDATLLRSDAYPFLIVHRVTKPLDVAWWIRSNKVRVLNVAGNRELINPGIGERVEVFMLAVFRKLAKA
jgi:Circularly permutated YpsA SLOG family